MCLCPRSGHSAQNCLHGYLLTLSLSSQKEDKCPTSWQALIHHLSQILLSNCQLTRIEMDTKPSSSTHLFIDLISSCWCSRSAPSGWNSSDILQEANNQTGGQWQHSRLPLCHSGRPPAPDHVVPQRCQGARHWQVPGKISGEVMLLSEWSSVFPIWRWQFVKLLRMIRKH